MLDVVRQGRLYVMAYSPSSGFGVDEVRSSEGFLTSYEYVTSNFDSAAAKLRTLADSAGTDSGLRISLIVLYSADLNRSKAFYERLGLRFTPERHGQGPQHFSCHLGDSVFEIYPLKKEALAQNKVRIGFFVPSVDEALERIKETGLRLVSPPQDSPWGRRAVVEDPEGNAVEITSRIAA